MGRFTFNSRNFHVSGEESRWDTGVVTSEASQGFVLGPPLSLPFVNDFAATLQHLGFYLQDCAEVEEYPGQDVLDRAIA